MPPLETSYIVHVNSYISQWRGFGIFFEGPSDLKKRAKSKANVRDVARHAGVSVATVSRVVNDSGHVMPVTKERVRSAIAELNYAPSAAARAINSGRTRIIGALVPTLDNSIFAQFLGSVEDSLLGNGLSLVVATTGDDKARETERARKLIDIGVEGLLVSGIERDDTFYDLIQHTKTPVISTSYFDPDAAFPTIGYDNAEASRLAAEHLKKHGHRRVAVFHGPAERNDRTRARIRGVRTVTDLETRFVEMPLRVSDAREAARDLLGKAWAPTAILALSDVLALGALFGLQSSGAAVPSEISIVGIDDLQISASTEPGISTVRLPVRRMGDMAAEALAHWVETGRRPEPVRLDAVLVERGSVARA